jgi:N-acetylglucosaminyldiphosphoundecaprenol N-acetyl-beta-D-mannosaminyltransferase
MPFVASDALVLTRLSTAEAVASSRPRVQLGSTFVDQLDFDQAVERITDFLWSGRPHQVVTVNLDFLSIAERSSEFRETLNDADLAVADGMPLVWLSRLRGQALPERVTGVDLVDACCEIAEDTGQGVFLLGAGPGVAQAAAERLQERHPGLRIVGTYTPPMGPLKRKENMRMLQMVREAAPGFLFVALGAPRQDLWIRSHLAELNVPVAMGVGCVFDLLAGNNNRAPSWMQAVGLEWAYRLVREPRRLWRRYLLNDLPLFARLLLKSTREDSPPADALAVPT